jgi:hypothetical protein
MTQTLLVLESLGRARAIADHAERLGVNGAAATSRQSYSHIGALLADAALQAGLNYRTVVRPRVERIQSVYPAAATLSGLDITLEQVGPGTFLSWDHLTKIERFTGMAGALRANGIQDVSDLRVWLSCRDTRATLLGIHGVGPKTFDYICCLAGLDHIPVDRHIKSFASEAGVNVEGYLDLQAAVSFAADLLGLPRRDFDAWIWHRLTSRVETQRTFAFS